MVVETKYAQSKLKDHAWQVLAKKQNGTLHVLKSLTETINCTLH